MSNIKSAGTTSQPAISADKELLLMRQTAEIKDKETLLREISTAIMEQKEKAQSSDKDTKQSGDTKQSKDTTQISETRRQSATDGTIPADKAQWTLEMEWKIWELFLEWQPDPDIDLPKQLAQLSKLYLALLEAALKYAEGDNLTQQLQRLDCLLAQKLNLLMEQKLEQLTSLLEETGQTTTLDNVRSNLYRQTAGRSISPQAAHALFAYGSSSSGKKAGTFSALSSFSGGGMIYQSSGKQNIRFQQTYYTQQGSWKEQIRQRNKTISDARTGIFEAPFKQGSSVLCTGKELEKANGFAAHIYGCGNLFKHPGISAGNEEVTGLLAAVMSIKGQVYAGECGRASSISLSIQNAIEKIINQYLNQKDASKVYYHTLAAYKQMKNPQKAIEDGQDYAYRQFRDKQSEPAYQKYPQYSKEAGFFLALAKGFSPEKELAIGIDILQKDWQNFLYAIGNRQSLSHLSKMNPSSPWGLLADTRTRPKGGNKTMGKLLRSTAVIAIIGVFAVLCFRFLL